MRAFLAFEVSDQVVGRLAAAGEELGRTRADLKIVRRDNLHFTVKFLGEISEEQVGEIDARLKGLELARFDVRVKGLGAFPDLRRPRVVWAGVAPESEESINGTASAFIAALEGIGQPEDRGFSPHITLARVRSPANVGELVSMLQLNAGRDFGVTTVSGLKLKSSVLSPSGPTYTDVREYGLR